MITVTNKVRVYEVNGSEPVQQSLQPLQVSSHHNYEHFIVLQFPGAENTITVSRRDLEAAIQNATNSNRHG